MHLNFDGNGRHYDSAQSCGIVYLNADEEQVSKKCMLEILKNWWRMLISELEMPKASTFSMGGAHPPPAPTPYGQLAIRGYAADYPNAT